MPVLRNLSISYRLKRCRVGVSVLNTVYYKMRMQNSYNVDTNRTGTVMHNINVNTGNIRIEESVGRPMGFIPSGAVQTRRSFRNRPRYLDSE